MADHADRDRSIEHLLRQTPPQSSSVPSAACVDAERLAAWAEGALRSDEAKQVEAHLADCARCQAMAAVFAESAPALPVFVPFWKHWSVRWLLPVWAASAAVLAWAWVVRQPPDEPATTIARVEQVEAPPFAPAQDAVREAAPVPPPAAAPAAEPVQEVESERLEQSFARPEPAPLERPGEAGQGDVAARQTPAPPQAPAPPPPAAPSAPDVAGRATEATAAPPAPAIQAQSGERSTAAARAGVGQDHVVMDGIATGQAVPIHARVDGSDPVEFGPPLDPRLSLAREPGAAAARGLPPHPRWRIAPDGRVDRSADGGASWIAVPLEGSPIIAAGSAPSRLVCWLAGRGGVVFRAVDGATFQRLPFPDAISLVSVQAVDATQATIVSDDGRVFTTTNAGGTWRQLP